MENREWMKNEGWTAFFFHSPFFIFQNTQNTIRRSPHPYSPHSQASG